MKGYPRDVWLILTASFFFSSSATAVIPIVTGFSESLGASPALMGIIGGMMNFCSLFCRPVAGNLADRISKYRLTMAGGALLFVGCLSCALAVNPMMVAAARLVTGVGFALCSVCMSTWMSNMLPRNKVGSGMGVYGMANALANALAPSLSVTIWQHFGYRAALFVTCFYAAAIMVLAALVRDKGEPTARKTSGTRLQVIEWRIFPIACITMLVSIPYFANQSFMVSYVAEKGLDLAINLFYPSYAVVLLVLRFSLKDFFDRVPFRILSTCSVLCSGVGMILLATLRSNVGLLLAAGCMAGGYGLMCSICQSTALLMAGEGRRGIANSTYYVGLDLGMMLGPVIGGLLYGHLPMELFYPVLLLTVPATLAIAWLSPACRTGAAAAQGRG